MDYTTSPLLFRIQKALRYVTLYGPQRTLAKIRGQYHVKRKIDEPPAPSLGLPGRDVGIIGCGNFAYSNIAYYLERNFGDVIQAAMDTDLNRAGSLSQQYKANYYTDDAARLLDDPAIKLLYIASNHASHAEYAIEALRRNKSVHIEKPHVVSMDQLGRLCSAMAETSGRVALGFNRPDSPIGQKIKHHIDSQSGAAMYNWFIAGHELPKDHWYFGKEEGGRVLGNLCHWTDFVFQLVAPENRYPITIKPTRAAQSDCDIAVNYIFGDGTIAALTFSAKGHTFEGVRESFSAHRGNVLIAMADFRSLKIEVVDRRYTHRTLYRDHGHEERICRSYRMADSRGAQEPGADVAYVWETGELFIKTRDALEEDRTITLQPFTPERLRARQ
jgi:predicted dehydrogenase